MRLCSLALLCACVLPASAWAAPRSGGAPSRRSHAVRHAQERPLRAKSDVVLAAPVQRSWSADAPEVGVLALHAPDVECPDCATEPSDLLVPGGFAHAGLHLYRQAVALQTVKVSDETTLKFVTVWPLTVQFKTSF